MEQKTIWFKARRYGYGWTPSTWQGWAVSLLYVFGFISSGTFSQDYAYTPAAFLLGFFPQAIILTIFIFVICTLAGETPRWQWGKKDGNP
jgi:hypothetical protein